MVSQREIQATLSPESTGVSDRGSYATNARPAAKRVGQRPTGHIVASAARQLDGHAPWKGKDE